MWKDLFKKTRGIPYSRTRDVFQQRFRALFRDLYQKRTILFIIFGLFVVVGSAIAFYQHQQSQTEVKAQNQLYRWIVKWQSLQNPPQASENASPFQFNTSVLQPRSLKTSDYEEIRSGYQRVIREHQGTKGAILATLYLSQLEMAQSRPREALESMQKIQPILTTESLIDGMAQMTLASLYESNNQCEKAIPVWSKVINAPQLSFLHADALLKQGLCFEGMKDTSKAIENYQKLIENHTQSPSGQMAQRLLHLIVKE